MWTVPQVLVRRTASPAYADFGGLSSLAALVVVRLDVVPLLGQELLGPSYLFISLVLGPLNSLVWYVPS